jgi:hypothetical protein
MEDTRTITVRNRMESIDDRLYIENLNVRWWKQSKLN